MPKRKLSIPVMPRVSRQSTWITAEHSRRIGELARGTHRTRQQIIDLLLAYALDNIEEAAPSLDVAVNGSNGVGE